MPMISVWFKTGRLVKALSLFINIFFFFCVSFDGKENNWTKIYASALRTNMPTEGGDRLDEQPMYLLYYMVYTSSMFSCEELELRKRNGNELLSILTIWSEGVPILFWFHKKIKNMF